MYNVRYENAPSNIQAAVKETLPLMNTLVSYAAKAKFGSQLRAKWFKDSANSQDLLKKLKDMDSYINKVCTVLTFVVKKVDHRVDGARVEATDFAQVMRADVLPSGTRVYILPNFAAQDPGEKLNTVCHELSHRVLKTTDAPGGALVYGYNNALHLGGGLSVNCAENFGYFYKELAIELGLLKKQVAA
jgi:hypothetical protein